MTNISSTVESEAFSNQNDLALLERSKKVIPGGVNSPVRSFSHVGGCPIFINSGKGPRFFTADGRNYIDYIGSWGPLILGHSHQIVVEAISKALLSGTSFGAPTLAEVEFAELISEIVPSLEMLRLVSSGTEATMSAVRLARGFTNREYVLKFDGCYHGHADVFLVKAGSGIATLGIAGSSGVTSATVSQTVSVEYNALASVEEVLSQIGPEKFAAIIVEPVAGNMGLVLPKPEFLKGLREICNKFGIVLIFDEVMSGFRVALGGAAERFDVKPDLMTLGKVIGGGLPVGAFGGRRDIMNKLAPLGPVYQAGTLSGNPLAVSAGHAVLKYLKENNPYPALEESTKKLAEGLKQVASKYEVNLQTPVCGSMFGIFFSAKPVENFSQAKSCRTDLFKKFFHQMLAKGIYLAPSPFEAGFMSITHDDKIISETLTIADSIFSKFNA